MCLTSLMLCLALSTGAESSKNLIRNPGFETSAPGDGAPDDWRSSGDASVTRRPSLKS